jgi:hypothetical protein
MGTRPPSVTRSAYTTATVLSRPVATGGGFVQESVGWDAAPRFAAFGLDIGATKWLACAASDARPTILTPGDTTDDPSQVFDSMARWLPAGAGKSIGCAFPGALDEAGVVSGWPLRPAWVGFPLRAALSELIGGGPVRIIDDGVAAALGEAAHGVSADLPDHLSMSLGTGIGGALVMEGRARPPMGQGGRTIGHWRVLGDDRPCPCGYCGCLQLALGSLPAPGSAVTSVTWPDGVRLVEVVGDVVAGIGVPAVVLTGGLLNRPEVREFLYATFTKDGTTCLVPTDPSTSAIRGALVVAGGAG